jgi:hypothetical protein
VKPFVRRKIAGEVMDDETLAVLKKSVQALW